MALLSQQMESIAGEAIHPQSVTQPQPAAAMYLQRFFVEGLAHASCLFGAKGEAAVVDPNATSISPSLQLMVTPVLCTS